MSVNDAVIPIVKKVSVPLRPKRGNLRVNIQGLFDFDVKTKRYLLPFASFDFPYQSEIEVFSYLKRLIDEKGRVVEGWDK